MDIYKTTHIGRVKNNNEDCPYIKVFDDGSCLLAVADGLGGQNAGEVASAIAVETLETFDISVRDIESHLVELFHTAHRRILAAAETDASKSGMGTTLAAAYINDHTVYYCFVGDSRIYVFTKGELICKTNDHTIPGILMKSGEISAEQARVHPLNKVILKCLGCKDYQPESGRFEITGDDLVLICSDGLHDEIPLDTIVLILKTKAGIDQRLSQLVEAALEAGGSDNITVVGAQL